jgi:asparagine synthase (glutamine-hydrolysing)
MAERESLIAGIFDPRGALASGAAERLRDAVAQTPGEPGRARLMVRGPLRVACAPGLPAAGDPLCLLEGDIDNAASIRAQLGTPAGARLQALIGAAYERWGSALFARLRGDFSLLVWDGRLGRGLLARDQLGVRSVFFAGSDSGALCFATELRALVAMMPQRPPPDPDGVAHWLAARPRAGTGTLYSGVSRLAPAGVLHFSESQIGQSRYWQPSFHEPERDAPADGALRVREAIAAAVRRRAGGASAAVLMSGGLDSASIAAVAARQGPAAPLACSAVFPDHAAVDESEQIASLREALGLGGIEAEVRSGGLIASAIDWIEGWQLPPVSWGEFWAAPLLGAAARAGATVVLGGDGGDELFATRAYLLADRLRAGRVAELAALARALPGAAQAPSAVALARAAGAVAAGGALPHRPHLALQRLLGARRLPPWLARPAARAVIASDAELALKRLHAPRWWAHAAEGLTEGIERAGVFELHRQRAARAGLRARHPLLDLDLIELVLRQPPEASFDAHRNRPVLRRAMAGLLPEQVRARTVKARFDSLIVDTLQGPDRPALMALLSHPRAEVGAYVDLAAVRRTLLCGGPPPGDAFSWMQQIWRLATAECWLRAQSEPGRVACGLGLNALARAAAPSNPRVILRGVAAPVSRANGQRRGTGRPRAAPRPVPFSALTGADSPLACERNPV